jgi:hypothetical protein
MVDRQQRSSCRVLCTALVKCGLLRPRSPPPVHRDAQTGNIPLPTKGVAFFNIHVHLGVNTMHSERSEGTGDRDY